MILAGTALALLAGCGSRSAPAGETVTVFAAASLADALDVLADSFETAHPGRDVVLHLAATSLLARQIEQGAPADLFFAASPDWMRRLQDVGRVAEPVLYPLGNRLVVAAPVGTPPLPSLERLAGLDRIAVAEPSSVPAGIYAKEALTCLGLWEGVAPNVVPTLDVRTALLTVSNRAADAAIVYASDLLAGAEVARVAVIPDACQPDIRYAAAVLARASQSEAARAFLRFATAPERRSTWERYGFRFRSGPEGRTPYREEPGYSASSSGSGP